MGTGKRYAFPWGDGQPPEQEGSSTTEQPFDGLKALQEHRARFDSLKDFFCGRIQGEPLAQLQCHPACQVARWSYSRQAREYGNKQLIEAVCKCCEEFLEVATRCVLMTRMNLSGPSSEVIRDNMEFEDASNRFQSALNALHLECRLNQCAHVVPPEVK